MNETNYIAHHGIKDQKWYVRRYQNPDGSLTPLGRIRYGAKKQDAVRIDPNKGSISINSRSGNRVTYSAAKSKDNPHSIRRTIKIHNAVDRMENGPRKTGALLKDTAEYLKVSKDPAYVKLKRSKRLENAKVAGISVGTGGVGATLGFFAAGPVGAAIGAGLGVPAARLIAQGTKEHRQKELGKKYLERHVDAMILVRARDAALEYVNESPQATPELIKKVRSNEENRKRPDRY